MKKEIELIQIIIEVKEEFIKHLGKSEELNAVIDDYKNDISLLNNVLFVLNEKTVNEANRACENCRDGFFLQKNTKCLVCGKVRLDD